MSGFNSFANDVYVILRESMEFKYFKSLQMKEKDYKNVQWKDIIKWKSPSNCNKAS